MGVAFSLECGCGFSCRVLFGPMSYSKVATGHCHTCRTLVSIHYDVRPRGGQAPQQRDGEPTTALRPAFPKPISWVETPPPTPCPHCSGEVTIIPDSELGRGRGVESILTPCPHCGERTLTVNTDDDILMAD